MPSDEAKAGPTKQFFVKMLTRDIDLGDAILDLIDNCIDGVIRQTKNNQATTQPYSGFRATIKATPQSFEIADNCGGIPRALAKERAFMLGRPDLERDEDAPTVGMYGIGMKRAIFKMGNSCTVESYPNEDEDAYTVSITPEWLDDDADPNWRLPLTTTDPNGRTEHGTKIHITGLYPSISQAFDNTKSTFLSELTHTISQHYSIIINKGFQITVNAAEIEPKEIVVLVPQNIGKKNEASITPYLYRGDYNNVSIELTAGFYRPLANEKEIDDELEKPRTSEHAGWTVICNDRVVLYGDKTSKTGWGTATVPRYHNQFIAIAGIVHFRSNSSFELPLNTTKRGVDVSSEVYLYILDIMRDAIKRFTDFTNKWKSRENETREEFSKLSPRTLAEITSQLKIEDKRWTQDRKIGPKGTGKKFVPNLPIPKDAAKNRRIAFSRPVDEVRLVAKFLFDEIETPASEVGARCFDEQLRIAQR